MLLCLPLLFDFVLFYFHVFYFDFVLFFVVFWHWFNRNNRKSRDLSFGDTHFGFRRYKESRKMQMKRKDNGKLVLFVCLTLWVYWPYLCVRCALLRRSKRTFWQSVHAIDLSVGPRFSHTPFSFVRWFVCSSLCYESRYEYIK